MHFFNEPNYCKLIFLKRIILENKIEHSKNNSDDKKTFLTLLVQVLNKKTFNFFVVFF